MTIRKRRISPRQKMINLIYVILLAMLAINVSPAGTYEDALRVKPLRVAKERILKKHEAKVNNMQAVVIPSANILFKGETLKTNIVVAAVDTIHKPQLFIHDNRVKDFNGQYDVYCNAVGKKTLAGELHIPTADGNIIKPFSYDYHVIEPTVTASAELTNVLYAGIDNPVNVAAPAIKAADLIVTASGAAVKQKNDGLYIVKPHTATDRVTLQIACKKEQRTMVLGIIQFHVRQLPDPMPFAVIAKEEHTTRYRGGKIDRPSLLTVQKINAAVDDGILDIDFKVLSFEAIFFDGMGNAIPLTSDGDAFSSQQRSLIQSLGIGKRFYVSRVTAVGPDGIQRVLKTPMEVIIGK